MRHGRGRGAGGQVGWNRFVQKAKPDGYDLAAYNVPHFIAQSIVYKTKYDINTFEPVANWGADPAVLIAPKDSPFNTMQDLVDFAAVCRVVRSLKGLRIGALGARPAQTPPAPRLKRICRKSSFRVEARRKPSAITARMAKPSSYSIGRRGSMSPLTSVRH